MKKVTKKIIKLMEENNELIHAISELQHPIIKAWRENNSLTKNELEALLFNNRFRIEELIDEFIDSIDAWDELYPDFWYQFIKVMKLKGKGRQNENK